MPRDARSSFPNCRPTCACSSTRASPSRWSARSSPSSSRPSESVRGGECPPRRAEHAPALLDADLDRRRGGRRRGCVRARPPRRHGGAEAPCRWSGRAALRAARHDRRAGGTSALRSRGRSCSPSSRRAAGTARGLHRSSCRWRGAARRCSRSTPARLRPASAAPSRTTASADAVPLLADPGGDVSRRYRASATPTVYVLRADGRVAAAWVGEAPLQPFRVGAHGRSRLTSTTSPDAAFTNDRRDARRVGARQRHRPVRRATGCRGV